MKKPKSMTTAISSIAAALLLCCPLAYAQAEVSFKSALATGALTESQYTTDTNAADPGDGWLALQKTQRGWELVPTTLKTLVVPSASGSLLVDVSSPLPRVQALLKNSRLKPGPVNTIKLADGSLQPTFAQGPEGYPAHSFGKGQEAQGFKVDTTGSGQALIVFTSGAGAKTKNTVIGKAPTSPTSEFTSVFWMGDLDHDGKIDLITTESRQPNDLRLWLSSEAQGTEALARVN